jgi:two-component sensor histidine kinase
VLALHVISDALITLAYLSIPFTLAYFTRRRTDLSFPGIFVCFALFIVACGMTHLMEIVTIWYPAYWLSGGIKAITALASVPTAILLAKLVPVALRLPSSAALQSANREIRRINDSLEARVTERTLELSTTNQKLLDEVEVRKRSEERLAVALREREALLQEVHHRVKNNLQVVASLVNMQIRSVGDSSTKEALHQYRSRVETIAQIHEMLYQAKDYARVPFSHYARNLVSRILTAVSSSTHIEPRFELEELYLPVEKAIPCGLIINELVGNALKHAFPERLRGAIRIELKHLTAHEIEVGVSDDGVGIAESFDPATTRSLGMHLVTMLVEQLDGRLQMVRSPGTSFRFSFPVGQS